jgi:hypothetical protein
LRGQFADSPPPKLEAPCDSSASIPKSRTFPTKLPQTESEPRPQGSGFFPKPKSRPNSHGAGTPNLMKNRYPSSGHSFVRRSFFNGAGSSRPTAPTQRN